MHKNVLDQENSILLVIDVQERFKDIIFQSEELIQNISKLIQAAKLLNIPIVCTEQYPKGLGNTVEPLKKDLGNATYFEKINFSCCRDSKFVDHLKALNRAQVIVCGIEAHVCVNQTVHDLLENDFTVHLIKDAVSSRNPVNIDIAVNKMRDSGAVISCLEIALFELLVSAKHEKFKDIQKLVI